MRRTRILLAVLSVVIGTLLSGASSAGPALWFKASSQFFQNNNSALEDEEVSPDLDNVKASINQLSVLWREARDKKQIKSVSVYNAVFRELNQFEFRNTSGRTFWANDSLLTVEALLAEHSAEGGTIDPLVANQMLALIEQLRGDQNDGVSDNAPLASGNEGQIFQDQAIAQARLIWQRALNEARVTSEAIFEQVVQEIEIFEYRRDAGRTYWAKQTLTDIDTQLAHGADNGSVAAPVAVEMQSLIEVLRNTLAGDTENQAPVAQVDLVQANQDEPLVIDVLINDTDPDNDRLKITTLTRPGNGSVKMFEEQIQYTPGEGFTGVDTFAYQIADSAGIVSTGNVFVNVNSADNVVFTGDALTRIRKLWSDANSKNLVLDSNLYDSVASAVDMYETRRSAGRLFWAGKSLDDITLRIDDGDVDVDTAARMLSLVDVLRNQL